MEISGHCGEQEKANLKRIPGAGLKLADGEQTRDCLELGMAEEGDDLKVAVQGPL